MYGRYMGNPLNDVPVFATGKREAPAAHQPDIPAFAPPPSVPETPHKEKRGILDSLLKGIKGIKWDSGDIILILVLLFLFMEDGEDIDILLILALVLFVGF